MTTLTENNQEFLPSEKCFSCPTRDIALFANIKPEDLHNMDSPITYQVIEKGAKLPTGPSRYRVARLLLWLSENSPDEETYMPGREDMGNILALTTETVSRVITELRRDGDLELLGANRAKANRVKLKKIVKVTA